MTLIETEIPFEFRRGIRTSNEQTIVETTHMEE
jgi:hypothetical protein